LELEFESLIWPFLLCNLKNMQNLNFLNPLVMYHIFTWFIDVFTYQSSPITVTDLIIIFQVWCWFNGKWNVAVVNAPLHDKDDFLFLSLMLCYIQCDLTPTAVSYCEYGWLQHFPTWACFIRKFVSNRNI
jgi:hypothetical protein